jgi:hypothetical protein
MLLFSSGEKIAVNKWYMDSEERYFPGYFIPFPRRLFESPTPPTRGGERLIGGPT